MVMLRLLTTSQYVDEVSLWHSEIKEEKKATQIKCLDLDDTSGQLKLEG